jgi:hypothetical protein
MPTSAATFQIFLILLPGFAAAYVVQILTVRAKQTDLDKVIEALLFSFVIYITYYLFHRGQQPLAFLHSQQTETLEFRPGNVIWLAAITLLYAVGMILFVNLDGTRVLRKINLTERTSRSSIWNDVFQGIQQKKDPSLGSIVQVELADGRSVQGLVGFYSDTADECSVFLSDARWIGDENTIVPIAGPGILLTKNANIVSISFLDPE